MSPQNAHFKWKYYAKMTIGARGLNPLVNTESIYHNTSTSHLCLQLVEQSTIFPLCPIDYIHGKPFLLRLSVESLFNHTLLSYSIAGIWQIDLFCSRLPIARFLFCYIGFGLPDSSLESLFISGMVTPLLLESRLLGSF